MSDEPSELLQHHHHHHHHPLLHPAAAKVQNNMKDFFTHPGRCCCPHSERRVLRWTAQVSPQTAWSGHHLSLSRMLCSEVRERGRGERRVRETDRSRYSFTDTHTASRNCSLSINSITVLSMTQIREFRRRRAAHDLQSPAQRLSRVTLRPGFMGACLPLLWPSPSPKDIISE